MRKRGRAIRATGNTYMSMKHNDWYDRDIEDFIPVTWKRVPNKVFQDRWGLTKRAVQYQLQRLERLGLIEMRYSRSGRGIRELRINKSAENTQNYV